MKLLSGGQWLCLLLSLDLLAGAVVRAQPASIPAFPGAEGFGASTPGGRGGKVIFVTNLDDSGQGSLRAACDAAGPRIVIFRVSGTIALKNPITVRNPFLTIAGQSAPGDGICVRNATFGISTHDVVVRYVRFRLGDESSREADSLDLLNGARDCIIDHCSATWSIDECLSLSGDVQNCTVQWCLIGESLNQSKHAKGKHGYGSLSRANGPVSWHHNLWIHNDARNPRLGDNYGRGTSPFFDVRNNLIYNFGGTASGLTQGKFEANYVGNYIRPGPSSRAKTPITVGDKSELKFHIMGNIFEGNDALTRDNTQFFQPAEFRSQVKTVTAAFAAPAVKTVPASEVMELLLPTVGASLPTRDAADARLVGHVRTKTGKLIDSQDEVGGWPALKSGAAPVDSDGDGMPDDWEKQRGLNPRDPADGAGDADKNGYTNVEEYLNGLVRWLGRFTAGPLGAT
jgi:pectate lyase